MSEDIAITEDNVTIHSSAFNDMFKLTPYSKGIELPSVSFSYEHYAGIFRGIWEKYLAAKQKPELLGYTLSDTGLIDETLHCIAPNSFFFLTQSKR